MCGLLISFLNKKTQFFYDLSKNLAEGDIFNFIGGKIFKHFLQSFYNHKCIFNMKVSAESSADNEVDFFGIFPSTSLIDHSCVPNAAMW